MAPTKLNQALQASYPFAIFLLVLLAASYFRKTEIKIPSWTQEQKSVAQVSWVRITYFQTTNLPIQTNLN